MDRLQQNIQWSQRDNFLDIPTDCPQRNERLGWTDDVTAFCATAAFNENIMPFMTKWLRDLASEQTPETGMPQVVPNVLNGGQDGAAFWGDVASPSCFLLILILSCLFDFDAPLGLCLHHNTSDPVLIIIT